MAHPEIDLIAYTRGELAEAERHRVERHLQICGPCRGALEEVREVLDVLANARLNAPPADWRRYRAELTARLTRRRRTRRVRPLALALATAGAAAVLFFTVQGAFRTPARMENLSAAEEALIARRLDLLRQYPVVEQLDLLEDLDILRQLDGSGPGAADRNADTA